MWSDLDLNFNTNASGDIEPAYEVDALRNSIRNILLTIPGSRRNLPDFAYGIEQKLFEAIDSITTEDLKTGIIVSLLSWDNRFTVDSIDIQPYPQDSTYIVNLYFTPVNSASQEVVEVVLKRNNGGF